MPGVDNIDLDVLIEKMADPVVGKNTNSILAMVKEFNIVLKEFSQTMDFLNKYGVLVPTLRIAAAKMNVDIDKPLAGNMSPASDWHKVLFENLNAMSPEEAVNEMVGMGKQMKKTSKVKE